MWNKYIHQHFFSMLDGITLLERWRWIFITVPVVRCFQPTHRNEVHPSANRSAPLVGTEEVDPTEGVCSNTSGQWNKQGVAH